MKKQVIVDTGVIVAIISKNDHYHHWAAQLFADIQPPLLTCESIISEAFYLLRHYQQSLILTLDSDFKVYRKNGNQIISLIFPDKSK